MASVTNSLGWINEMSAYYSDYEGTKSVWSYARTKEKAIREMAKELVENLMAISHTFDEAKVRLTRSYYCNNCEFHALDSDICCECGEVINKKGRQCYYVELEEINPPIEAK